MPAPGAWFSLVCLLLVHRSGSVLGRSCSLRDCSRALLQAVPAAHRWCSNALGWVGAFPPVLKLSCCTACSPRAAPRSVLDSPTGQAQARQMSSLPREFLAQRPLHPAVGAFQKSLKPAIIELLNSVISLQRNKQTKKAVPPFLFFFSFPAFLSASSGFALCLSIAKKPAEQLGICRQPKRALLTSPYLC